MTSLFIAFALFFLGFSATMGMVGAQEKAAKDVAPQNDWVAQCTSAGRGLPADCLLEQKLVVTETDQRLGVRAGSLLGAVKIRVPAEPRQPTMLVQLPQNLFLPAGLALRVDAGEPVQLPLQTCDARGCYAGMAVSNELLESLKKGAKLHLGIQTVRREKIDIIVPLKGFTAGYRKVE